jgi:hypothetical protein
MKQPTLQLEMDSIYWASISIGDSTLLPIVLERDGGGRLLGFLAHYRGYSHGIASWSTVGKPKTFLSKRIDGRKAEVESVLRQIIGMRPGEYVLTATSKSGDQYNANVTIGYHPPRCRA